MLFKFSKLSLVAPLSILVMTGPAIAGPEIFSNKDKIVAPVAPISPARFNWSGFYIGLNLGAQWNEYEDEGGDFNTTINQLTNIPLPGRGIVIVPGTVRPFFRIPDDREVAFTGGIQLGYNLQLGHFLVGFEGDFNGNTSDRSSNFTNSLPPTILSAPATLTVERDLRNEWTSSARLRVGYTWQPMAGLCDRRPGGWQREAFCDRSAGFG